MWSSKRTLEVFFEEANMNIIILFLSFFMVIRGGDIITHYSAYYDIRDDHFCDFGFVDLSALSPLVCASHGLPLVGHDPCSAWIYDAVAAADPGTAANACRCGKAACVDKNRPVDPTLFHNAIITSKCHILDWST